MSSFLEAGVLENSDAYLLKKLSLGVSANLFESNDYKMKIRKWFLLGVSTSWEVAEWGQLAAVQRCTFAAFQLPNWIWLGENMFSILHLFYLKSDFFLHTTNNLSSKTVPLGTSHPILLNSSSPSSLKACFLLWIHNINNIVPLCFLHLRADWFWLMTSLSSYQTAPPADSPNISTKQFLENKLFIRRWHTN